MLHGFELAQLGGQLLIFLRLPGLAAQIGELAADLADDIPQAFEIDFCSLQARFGFLAAAVKARDAGRVFENAAALLRLGVDKLANLALLHKRLAARPGGRVGEQDLNVLRPDLLAVHLVNRAGLALDAARDFQHIGVVEGSGRCALRIVDGDHHLGHVARRALVGACKDHVVHGGGAHALVGGLAHHPAQRFQEIGFAATVRADNARQPRPDDKLGWLDKRFETEKPQPRNLQGAPRAGFKSKVNESAAARAYFGRNSQASTFW